MKLNVSQIALFAKCCSLLTEKSSGLLKMEDTIKQLLYCGTT